MNLIRLWVVDLDFLFHLTLKKITLEKRTPRLLICKINEEVSFSKTSHFVTMICTTTIYLKVHIIMKVKVVISDITKTHD